MGPSVNIGPLSHGERDRVRGMTPEFSQFAINKRKAG